MLLFLTFTDRLVLKLREEMWNTLMMIAVKLIWRFSSFSGISMGFKNFWPLFMDAVFSVLLKLNTKPQTLNMWVTQHLNYFKGKPSSIVKQFLWLLQVNFCGKILCIGSHTAWQTKFKFYFFKSVKIKIMSVEMKFECEKLFKFNFNEPLNVTLWPYKILAKIPLYSFQICQDTWNTLSIYTFKRFFLQITFTLLMYDLLNKITSKSP